MSIRKLPRVSNMPAPATDCQASGFIEKLDIDSAAIKRSVRKPIPPRPGLSNHVFGHIDKTDGGVGGKPQCDCNCHQPPTHITVGGKPLSLEVELGIKQPTPQVAITYPQGLSPWAHVQLQRRLNNLSAEELYDHPIAIQCIMRSVVFRDKHTIHPPVPWPEPRA